jgi:hypothetical protein
MYYYLLAKDFTIDVCISKEKKRQQSQTFKTQHKKRMCSICYGMKNEKYIRFIDCKSGCIRAVENGGRGNHPICRICYEKVKSKSCPFCRSHSLKINKKKRYRKKKKCFKEREIDRKKKLLKKQKAARKEARKAARKAHQEAARKAHRLLDTSLTRRDNLDTEINLFGDNKRHSSFNAEDELESMYYVLCM